MTAVTEKLAIPISKRVEQSVDWRYQSDDMTSLASADWKIETQKMDGKEVDQEGNKLGET